MDEARAKGMLKAFMLGIIIQKGRVHGYEIYKDLADLGRNRWRPSIGTIYRMLNEMVGEGLIKKQEITEGRRTIIYYRPTQQGISEFIKRSKLFLEKVHLGLSLLTATLQELKKAGMSDEELELKLRKVLEVLKKYF